MRNVFAGGVRAGLIAVSMGLAPTAEAQSFLQSLFGGGQQQQQPYYQRSMPRPGVPAVSMPSVRDGAWSREIRRYSPATVGSPREVTADESGEPRASSGKYRTLCVRTCDGYYFPIGNSVSRSRFMRDAAQCRASCGEEARLFYHPAGSDNVSTMLDLAGRSYLRMPTAFKYRKSLTDGCACRPMPWSAAEMQRHQQYAADAAQAAAEADARRIAAEAVEAARSQQVAVKSKPVVSAVKPERDESRADAGRVVASTPNGAATAPQYSIAEVANAGDGSGPPPIEVANATEASTVRTTTRSDRMRASPGPRSGDRTVARRQQVVARAGGTQGGVSSWLPTSGGKYTWPGDAPRR